MCGLLTSTPLSLAFAAVFQPTSGGVSPGYVGILRDARGKDTRLRNGYFSGSSRSGFDEPRRVSAGLRIRARSRSATWV